MQAPVERVVVQEPVARVELISAWDVQVWG